MSLDHRLTRGHVLRHRPPQSSIGPDVALLDIAQDFLLTHLSDHGLFDLAVFKGGRAPQALRLVRRQVLHRHRPCPGLAR